LEFFSVLIDKYSQINPGWRKIKPQPQQWAGFGAGRSGLAFNWGFRSQNRLSVELYIDTGDVDENKRIFDQLSKTRKKIDSELPGISWERLEGRRASRIAVYKDIGASIKSLPKDDYPKVIEWAVAMMNKFTNIFGHYIKNLQNM
jgi:hypothetical protein